MGTRSCDKRRPILIPCVNGDDHIRPSWYPVPMVMTTLGRIPCANIDDRQKHTLSSGTSLSPSITEVPPPPPGMWATFWQWRKVRCHGNGPFVHASVYKMLTLYFSHIYCHCLTILSWIWVRLGTHVGLEVKMWVTYFLTVAEKCVAMVTVPLSMLLCRKC